MFVEAEALGDFPTDFGLVCAPEGAVVGPAAAAGPVGGFALGDSLSFSFAARLDLGADGLTILALVLQAR